MPTGLAYSPEFLKHRPSPSHPESPRRLQAIHTALAQAGLLESLTPVDFTPADTTTIQLVHSAAYIRRVEQACRDNLPFIDSPDSEICPDSYQVARLAVAAVIAAADGIMSGHLTNALCLVRPPGHHAEIDRSLGFCLFNNVAIAARHLLSRHNLDRILIIDWDVHHGNGTQHIFEAEPAVFYASLHQSPASCYPGTGWADEKGTGPGLGTTLNIPFEPGSGDSAYRTAFESQLTPAVESFKPQFILVSSGFDAHADDPLASLALTFDGFDFLIRQTVVLANTFAQNRLLVILEGGYNLDVLAQALTSQARLLLQATADPHASTP